MGEEDGEDWVDGVLDGWVWETSAPVVSLDDLIVPTTAVAGSCHGFQAVGVSPPLKVRILLLGLFVELGLLNSWIWLLGGCQFFLNLHDSIGNCLFCLETFQ